MLNSLKTLIKLNIAIINIAIFFLNNHYIYIITGDLDIVNNEKLCQIIFKASKYQETKHITFEGACIVQSSERISNNKGIHNTIWQDGNVILCHQ